jgi:hypothetical protein
MFVRARIKKWLPAFSPAASAAATKAAQPLTAAVHQNLHQDFLDFDETTSPTGAVPVGPPGGRVGNLIVGGSVGLGGKLIRTVSFFGFRCFGSGSSVASAAAATLGPRGGFGGGTSGCGFGAGCCSSFMKGKLFVLQRQLRTKGLFAIAARLA